MWRHKLVKKNYNTHIAQHLTKQQPDNEIWSINRTTTEIFFSKIMNKIRERILTSKFANCKAYFIDCKVILQDFLGFVKQTFLIFKRIYLTDKIDWPFLEKYNSSKNISFIYSSLTQQTSKLTSSIPRIGHFSQDNLYIQLIHFSHYLKRRHKHEIEHSHCIYTLYLYFIFFVFIFYVFIIVLIKFALITNSE